MPFFDHPPTPSKQSQYRKRDHLWYEHKQLTNHPPTPNCLRSYWMPPTQNELSCNFVESRAALVELPQAPGNCRFFWKCSCILEVIETSQHIKGENFQWFLFLKLKRYMIVAVNCIFLIFLILISCPFWHMFNYRYLASDVSQKEIHVTMLIELVLVFETVRIPVKYYIWMNHWNRKS